MIVLKLMCVNLIGIFTLGFDAVILIPFSLCNFFSKINNKILSFKNNEKESFKFTKFMARINLIYRRPNPSPKACRSIKPARNPESSPISISESTLRGLYFESNACNHCSSQRRHMELTIPQGRLSITSKCSASITGDLQIPVDQEKSTDPHVHSPIKELLWPLLQVCVNDLIVNLNGLILRNFLKKGPRTKSLGNWYTLEYQFWTNFSQRHWKDHITPRMDYSLQAQMQRSGAKHRSL